MLRRLLRQLQQIIIALVLLAVSIGGLELWLRSVRPAAPRVVASQADSARQEWLIPSVTVHHRMRPLAEFSDSAGHVLFRTNSLGLRGREPLARQPPADWRILLLGDDTISGLWLEDEFILSAWLEKHLDEVMPGRVEVINAGVPGYSPLLSLIQYQQDLMHLKPDLVVLHFDMSDVSDDAAHRCCLHEEGGRPICLHRLLASSPQQHNSVLSLLRELAIVDLLRRQLGNQPEDGGFTCYDWTRQPPRQAEGQIRHVMDSVARIVQVAARAGHPFLLTTAPVGRQILQRAAGHSISERSPAKLREGEYPFRLLASWAAHAGIQFLDVTDAFRKFETPERLFQEGSERPSRYGMALYARELAQEIVRLPAIARGTGARVQ